MTDKVTNSRAAIVVVNYRSTKLIVENLRRSDLDARHSVYVVDNFSDEVERALIEQECKSRGWKLIARVDNPGFGTGANDGLSAAFLDGHDRALLLNPDASIDEQNLELLCSQGGPEVLVTPRIVDSSAHEWFSGARLGPVTGIARHSRLPKYRVDPDWITAACLLVPREGWIRWGEFRTDMFMYWEDVELTARWRRLGGVLKVAEGVVATHDSGGTQGPSKSPLYVKYNLRNRRIVGRDQRRPVRFLWGLATPYYLALVIRVTGLRRFFGSDGRAYRGAAFEGLFSALPPRTSDAAKRF